MPIKLRSGEYVSFKYEPSHLKGEEDTKTDFANDISLEISLPNLKYSGINLDGGNVVFSPSKERAILSDRVLAENPERDRESLHKQLEDTLKAEVIIIPSLISDLTGHADDMVRFTRENTVLTNRPKGSYTHESKVKKALEKQGIETIILPFFGSRGGRAVGCYINYLEADKYILLPVFGVDTDTEAVKVMQEVRSKEIVTLNINEIAADGGLLKCISWES